MSTFLNSNPKTLKTHQTTNTKRTHKNSQKLTKRAPVSTAAIKTPKRNVATIDARHIYNGNEQKYISATRFKNVSVSISYIRCKSIESS